MPHLKTKRVAPPGEFRYLVFDTETWIRSLSWGALLKATSRHFHYHGLNCDRLAERVEEQICWRCPPGTCLNDDGSEYVPPLNRAREMTAEMAVNASKALVRHLLDPRLENEFVARRRMHVCAGCVFRTPYEGCSCGPLRKMVEGAIPEDRKRAMPYKSGVCALCGCSILAKANLPLDLIRSTSDKMWFPDYCWQNTP